VLLFVPFSFLSDVVALRVWTALSIAFYVLASHWIARAVAPGRTVSVAAAVLVSQPAIASLLLGQIGAVLMLAVTAAWLADRDDRPLRAGVLLGVAVAAKPFLAVFAGYAVWRRSRAFTYGLAAGFCAALLVGLAAAGIDGYRAWFAALGQISWTAHVANGSLLGLFTRLFGTTPGVLHTTPLAVRPRLIQPLWWASVSLIVVVGIVALARTKDRDRAWAILLIASLLISPLGWVYYAAMFAGPALVAIRCASPAARVAIAAGSVCLFVPPVGAIDPITNVVFGSIYAWGFLLIFAGVAGPSHG
jgi:glycosyl transferase family 87